jgi:hypothetical protein
MKTNPLFTGGLAAMKPPRAPRGTIPTGSRILGLGFDVPTIGGGPGMAPAGFIGGATSQSEWYIYWALTEIRGPEGDEGRWDYQSSTQGGRHIVGGSVVDFTAYENQYIIGIRIQTFYFHLASPEGSYKQASDLEQKVHLQDGTDMYVVDVYEQDFIHDPSGEAAKREVLRALSLIEEYNPRSAGLVFP